MTTLDTPERQALLDRSKALLRTDSAGQYIVALGWICMVLGSIGGIALAMTSEVDESGFFDETTHPYIGLGIGLAFSAVVTATVLIGFGWFLQAWSLRQQQTA
jgi:hypothetical protein